MAEEQITKNAIKELLNEQTNDILTAVDKKIEGKFEGLIETMEKVFVTKVEFANFRDEYKEEFSKFLTKIDKKTGEEVDGAQKQTMLVGKVQRHEKWINQIAKKVDLKLES